MRRGASVQAVWVSIRGDSSVFLTMGLNKRRMSAVIIALLNQEDDYEIRSKNRRLWSKEWLRKREIFSHDAT